LQLTWSGPKKSKFILCAVRNLQSLPVAKHYNAVTKSNYYGVNNIDQN